MDLDEYIECDGAGFARSELVAWAYWGQDKYGGPDTRARLELMLRSRPTASLILRGAGATALADWLATHRTTRVAVP